MKLRISWLPASIIALLCDTAIAVYADEAYQVDYHHALLGLPLQHSTFFQQPYSSSKASLVYTLSEKLVVGAVNPKDGSLVWRQQLHPSSNETAGFLRAGVDQDIVISAWDDQVAAWAASDGRLAWSNQFSGGAVKDIEILELQDVGASADAKDAIALFEGKLPAVRRLDGKTGSVKWEFHDESGDVPYQVSASATNVYYVSLHSTMLGGLKVKVTMLDPLNGRKVDQYTLSSESEVSSTEDIVFVGANSACPLLAWTDRGKKVVKVNIIGNKQISSYPVVGGTDIQSITLHAPHRANAVPHFLIHYQGSKEHWAEVYHVDLKGLSITKAYDLPKVAGPGAFATSSLDANVFFTRTTEDQTFVFSSASHGILGRWVIDRQEWTGWPGDAQPIHAVSEVIAKSGSTHAARSAVLLSSGDWVLVRNGEVDWTRPEALAGVTTAVWTDVPATKALAHEIELESHKSFIGAFMHRATRHLKGLTTHAPAWLGSIPNTIIQRLAGASPDAAAESPGKDRYGFRKIIVAATENGRLIGLDSAGGGQIIWSIAAARPSQGQKWSAPLIQAHPEGFVTVENITSSEVRRVDILTGTSLGFEPAAKKASIENDSKQPTQARLLSVTLKLTGNELVGLLTSSKNGNSLWRFTPTGQERLLSVTTRPSDEPVASIGRVLGDRRVLYKYLNPNIALVVTVSDTASAMSIFLLDTVSGSTLHTITHTGVDTTRPITSAMSENWFAYAFCTSSAMLPSRGCQLAVADLYESPIPDDRGPLGSSANYSSLDTTAGSGDIVKPHAVSQTYHIPEEISSMTVTQTRQGITSRQLLVTLPESKAIAGIPRSVIDPRRPVGRDPTAAEAAEGLSKYSPVLEFDPRWFLTHKREVIGIKKITTCPSSLESTSLVFAYGLDVFGTRVSPSSTFDVLGKEFNKVQMLATVAALAVGVTFVTPLVRRKQINARWQVL